MATITVEILTGDAAWIARHGKPGHAGRTAIDVDTYEELTFGPRAAEMIRFDLGADIPRDWGNRWAMVPRSHTSLA